jgi:hypothetical protein
MTYMIGVSSCKLNSIWTGKDEFRSGDRLFNHYGYAE